MEPYLQFQHDRRDGLHTYVVRAGDRDFPEPVWPGLFKPYPPERNDNPYLRHGINNADGEAVALWRALAWALTAGTARFAIPTYYRDQAATLLGLEVTDPSMVSWEYEMDVEQADPVDADRGFVPARACVPIRPTADAWQREHQGFAGLFPLASFADPTALELAVSGDASSEITLFGMTPHGRGGRQLRQMLNQPTRPHLSDILRPGDIFVDVSVVRDRFLGHTSYLTVRTAQPTTDMVHRLARHYSDAYRRYRDRAERLTSIADFHRAVEELLTSSPGRVA